MVYNLSSPELPVIGLLTGLPINGMGPQAALRGVSAPAWAVMEQVEKLFEVQTIEADAAQIPEEVDVLLLVHPKQLGDSTLYAIDQFVLAGGRALVFIDPHSESEQAPPQAMPMLPATRKSELAKLFTAWGVESDPEKVVGDLQIAAKVRMQRQQQILTIDYPVWLNALPELFDQDDTVTAELRQYYLCVSGLYSAVGECHDDIPAAHPDHRECRALRGKAFAGSKCRSPGIVTRLRAGGSCHGSGGPHRRACE